MELSNPKQGARVRTEGWYRYYAGFSPDFVNDALEIAEADGESLDVLDPWVGAGTTCAIAADRGHMTTGIDINPALVVIAKARLLQSDIGESLSALTEEILLGATSRESMVDERDEPLLSWFGPSSAVAIRAIERSIFRLLVDPESNRAPVDHGLHHLSTLAAFFYVALFKVARSRLRAADTSNPTWIKAQVPARNRARPQAKTLHEEFRRTQENLALFLGIGQATKSKLERQPNVGLGSSTSLNLDDASVDVAITSPPYCTRIDYVAGVRPELAILGCDHKSLKALRHMTLGNPTVPESQESDVDYVPSARKFLKKVKAHPSKASKSYYYRYFETYFKMLNSSLSEMHRVIRPQGRAFIVVQDSYYKEVRLDLPLVTSEMAEAHGWAHSYVFDFPVGRTMAVVNPKARNYRRDFSAVESVLLLERQ